MENFNNIFTIKSNNIAPGKGKILISEPFLPDYYFGRSVVLLIEHNEDGTFGLIINKHDSRSVNDVLTDLPSFDAPLYIGGPVKNESLFFIHTRPDLIDESIPIIKSLFWGGNIEMVKELITLNLIGQDEIRFFSGYSGWVPEQLDNELKRNSWLVSSISSRLIMKSHPDALWENSLKKLGGEYSYWINYPEDPQLN